jgi:hypothetical protein
MQDFPMDNGDNQPMEVVIKNFTELPITRPFQEYCKPFS